MCEEVGGCSSEGEARLARSRQLALSVSSSGTEGAHPALVPLRGFASELAVRLRQPAADEGIVPIEDALLPA